MAIKRSTIVNLDKVLDAVQDEPVHPVQIQLFGREWTLHGDFNLFAAGALGTGSLQSIVDFFSSVIVEDQADEFLRVLSQQRGLNAQKIGALMTAIVEAVAERPTQPPSVSSRGGSSRTSAPNSRARSSARVVR